MEIKYPLEESQKQIFRDRLDTILAKTEGSQVIILMDENKITDYYQNTCVPSVVRDVEKSAREYARLTDNRLINEHE